MGCCGRTWPSKFFLEKMWEGCFQIRLAFIYRLSMASSISVVPCSSFRLSSGVVMGSRCAWSSSGAWSGECWSGSVCWWQTATCQILLRLSLPAPGACRCPSCGLTCLRLQERMCLRWWPHSCVKKSKTFIPDPKFSEVDMKTHFYGWGAGAVWCFWCVCICLCKIDFWDWEVTSYLAVLQSHLD